MKLRLEIMCPFTKTNQTIMHSHTTVDLEVLPKNKMKIMNQTKKERISKIQQTVGK
jgi:hypothetical protein